MKFPKNKSVVIKKRMAERVVLTILMFVLFALFMFILFMPFHNLVKIEKEIANLDNLCYCIGGVGTVLFFVLFAYQVYYLAVKSMAIVITEDGIYDFVTAGKGVGFIDKGKITSIRIFGTKRKPILGIQVDNSKHLVRTAKKAVQDAVMYNLDMKMPAIVIYQKDLSCSVKEAANLIYEKLNSLSFPLDEANKNVGKIPSETKSFTNKNVNKKDSKRNEDTKKAQEAKKAEEARLAEEAKKAEEARLAEEAKKAEEVRKAEEARLAEEMKKAEAAKRAEEMRLVQEAKRAEESRIAEEAKKAAEATRLAEEAKKAAETARLAEEAKKAAEAARLAEEAKKVADAARLAEEAKKAAEMAAQATEASKTPKYVFPTEKFIKAGQQGEEDPSPQPYFEILKKDA